MKPSKIDDHTLPLFPVPPMTALEAIAGDDDTLRQWAKAHDVGRELWAASRHNVWAKYTLATLVARAAIEQKEETTC